MQAGVIRLFANVSFGTAVAAAGTLAVAVLALSAPQAQAATLPPAEYYNVAHGYTPAGDMFDGGQQPDIARVAGSSFGTHWDFYTSNNYQSPAVNAFAISGPHVKGETESALTYYIRFNGAPGDVNVRVRAEGATFAEGENLVNGYGHNEASASVFIARYYDNGGTDRDLVSGFANSNQRGANQPGNQGFTIDQTFSFVANAVYRVLMQASAESFAEDGSPNEGRLSMAYVDPFFSTPDGYTLEISDGIGNGLVATTPIPAALPLFASALGGMGLLGWRRKRKAAANVAAAAAAAG